MKENEIISTIMEIIKNETGIVIQKEKSIDLEIVIKSRLIFHNIEPEKYVDFIKNNNNEIILVASCFTIQETSFYRYKSHYDRLKLEIIPELILKGYKGKKSINILSAGCATGEEPYTISMILHDLISDLKIWDVKITATDINENALKIASEAIYSEYKLRNIDEWYINRYFTKVKHGKNILYKLNDSVKNLVSFKQCNLIREPFELIYLEDVDIILCENVIIYFCMESIQRLISNFYNILKTGGYLFLGYSETLNFVKHKFNLSWWNDSFIYTKSENKKEDLQYNLKELIQGNEGENEDIDKDDLNKKSYEDIINLVIRNYNEELFDNVSILLKQIESRDIKLDEVFYIIKAEFKFDRKDYINATNECRKAININSHSIDAHLILAVIYLELNMLDGASFEIKTSLYIDSSSILANYYFALLNKKMDNDDEYKKYISISRKLLYDNHGILKIRVYPINRNTRKTIYDGILNLEEHHLT